MRPAGYAECRYVRYKSGILSQKVGSGQVIEPLWRLVARCVPGPAKLTSGGYNRIVCVEYGPCRAGDALACVFHASGGRCERLLHGYEKHRDRLVLEYE